VAAALDETLKIKRVAPGHCTSELGFKVLMGRFKDRFDQAGVGQTIRLPWSPKKHSTSTIEPRSASGFLWMFDLKDRTHPAAPHANGVRGESDALTAVEWPQQAYRQSRGTKHLLQRSEKRFA
jgi:hypothetical protein